MADIERMTVVFPQPMAARIREAVEAGEYASASEAVQDAVRLWFGRRALREHEVETLRQAWDDGKASGTQGPIDFADLRREARARLTAAKDDTGHAA